MAQSAAASGRDDTCLLVSAENIVSGSGNWFLYAEFSKAAHRIEAGDRLEYDIFLAARNPLPSGGVDADLSRTDLPQKFSTRPWLRDSAIHDQHGLRLHADALLDAARGQWLHREFDLSPAAGATTERWTIVFEGDASGRYVQLLDNIRIVRDGTPVLTLYTDGPPPELRAHVVDGYSRTILATAAPRSAALDEARIAELLGRAKIESDARRTRDAFRAELDVARRLAAHEKQDALLAQIDAAARAEDTAAYEQGRFDAYLESLHRARHDLSHAHPMMLRYTGHLVGHAHIDLQWLWEWEETVQQIIPQTFGQAVKFLDEFSEFTFSQSSACLYESTRAHHPQLFAEMRRHVQSGRWEIVGGRWCEGDNNMISPESTVRQFLYGQRWFERNFGRICTVGWEPDTFGHAWTMPQVLRKAGIDSYYFCRAGKNVPLFWWEGPDGTRVLAFEEPATGGWYNDVVSDAKVDELVKFATTHDARDHLMVYGVGNHGGGPTREYIEAALEMQKRGLWPRIRFSTASAFFRLLHEQVAAGKVTPPIIAAELNPVFDGCYTAQARIKKYNRDSEALLLTLESTAALAAVRARGAASRAASTSATQPAAYSYPRAALEALWRNVLWNHHHDTLPGSCIHAAAEYSHAMYERDLKAASELLSAAQDALLPKLSAEQGCAVTIFNPLAWPRSELLEVEVPVPAGGTEFSVRDAGGALPVQVLGPVPGASGSLRLLVPARDVPACGYKTVSIEIGAAPPETLADVPPAPPAGEMHFQMLHEKPNGMSAWVVGEIDATQTLAKPDRSEEIESGPLRRRTRQVWDTPQGRITQDVLTTGLSPLVEYRTTVDWRAVGNASDGSFQLKAAFPSGLPPGDAIYDIPFGEVARPAAGSESVALKWCAVTGRPPDPQASSQVFAVFNDCKHAYDVRDGVIRLTLLRSSYYPDPRPDVGTHTMRYAACRLTGRMEEQRADMVRRAWDFNHPLRTRVRGAPLPAGEPRPLPPGAALLAASPQNIIVTGVKLAEENGDVILRAYECSGQATQARVTLGFDFSTVEECDLLERRSTIQPPLEVRARTLTVTFRPWEIRTLRIALRR